MYSSNFSIVSAVLGTSLLLRFIYRRTEFRVESKSHYRRTAQNQKLFYYTIKHFKYIFRPV
jgi:hypothetical protein